jgi:hypothetical protein
LEIGYSNEGKQFAIFTTSYLPGFMKNLFTSLSLLFLLSAAGPAQPRIASTPTATGRPAATVYVCMSNTSYAYHSADNCSGLNRCSHEVKAMSAEAAAKLGKRACRKCY